MPWASHMGAGPFSENAAAAYPSSELATRVEQIRSTPHERMSARVTTEHYVGTLYLVRPPGYRAWRIRVNLAR
jgi:hypothetical protein